MIQLPLPVRPQAPHRHPPTGHNRAVLGPGDRGSAAAELTLITPVLVLILLLLVAAARLAFARQMVNDAAHQAARAASTAPTPHAATKMATATAYTAITEGGVACRRLQAATDTSRFQPGGRVSVQLSCAVALSDLTLLSLPGTRTISGRFTVPIDRWRATTTTATRS